MSPGLHLLSEGDVFRPSSPQARPAFLRLNRRAGLVLSQPPTRSGVSAVQTKNSSLLEEQAVALAADHGIYKPSGIGRFGGESEARRRIERRPLDR